MSTGPQRPPSIIQKDHLEEGRALRWACCPVRGGVCTRAVLVLNTSWCWLMNIHIDANWWGHCSAFCMWRVVKDWGQTAIMYTDRTPPRVRLRGLDFILLKTPISVGGGGGGGLGPFPEVASNNTARAKATSADREPSVCSYSHSCVKSPCVTSAFLTMLCWSLDDCFYFCWFFRFIPEWFFFTRLDFVGCFLVNCFFYCPICDVFSIWFVHVDIKLLNLTWIVNSWHEF